MVSAEPRIYITVPSTRIWVRNNRGKAIALAVAGVAAVVLLVLAVILVLAA
ncbi:hypothetical protein [[Mycobacterium] wendilense]|uniref:Peptide ABC transporter permease n=1 Tax=[Mycobacterium] wendilense TaxID=3064284 RepID=A0ABM9M7X7_9MYCO|nr:hypothetical protein [Mycolicibacterium sp. MU0050]CAJ1578346.1 hypothetical protein MU0050_000037 [Mycolicibacterium sp. MU0050]